MGEVKRAVRVAERLREELATLLIHDVRDPRLAGVVVSRIEMPDDLRSARVFVRTLDPAAKGGVIAALERAAGMLRREVTARVKLRYAPTLTFVFDAGQDNATRIEQLLEEVREEDRRRSRE